MTCASNSKIACRPANGDVLPRYTHPLLKNTQPLIGTTPKDLRQLWINMPYGCHMDCHVCFALSDTARFNAHYNKKGKFTYRVESPEYTMTKGQISSILGQFSSGFPLTKEEKMAGVKKAVGICGAGEPFFNDYVRGFTRLVINYCLDHDMIVEVFTTADRLNSGDLDLLARGEGRFRIKVKYNSLDHGRQNAWVGGHDPSYAQRRDAKVETLIKMGLNDGRVALVTSLERDNGKDVIEMQKFARKNHLPFEFNIVLPVGRAQGYDYGDASEIFRSIETMQKIDAEYGFFWEATSPTFLANNFCTRYCYHMFIDSNGLTYPCDGSTHLLVGDAKKTPLDALWNCKLMRIIREHKITGACMSCLHLAAGECASCLGRCSQNIDHMSILKDRSINTEPCVLFKKA